MSPKSFFCVLLFGLFNVLFLQAQNKAHIIDDLQSNTNASEGSIRVVSDPAITALLGKPSSQAKSQEGTGDASNFVERTGFRIQIFMGNNPNTARSEAYSKRTSINTSFPDLTTYLSYEAPNWKLLAGDFVTREEATVFKQQLQREFPQFGKEMYIIVDKIRVSIK